MNQKALALYILLAVSLILADVLALELLYLVSGPGIYPALGPWMEVKGTLLLVFFVAQFVLLSLAGYFSLRREGPVKA